MTAEVLRAALACIPPDVDRDTWARVAMALKASDVAESAAFELFDEWSARGATYSQRGTRDTWRSVKAGGAVTVGTLFGIATDHGFKWADLPPLPGALQSPAAPAAAAHPAEAASVADTTGPGADAAGHGHEGPAGAELAEAARQRREAEAEQWRKRADEAARKARGLWAAAEAAGSSPYLLRKGVQAHGLRFMRDGTILVPMLDAAGTLQNVQRIAPAKPADGGPEKRFLAGGRKSGLFHCIGAVEGAPVLLLAEGYATGASLHEATGHPVAVAFDAGNLVHVARELRTLHPALPLLVCADNDHETEAARGINTGRAKAAAAVRAALAGGGQADDTEAADAAPDEAEPMPAAGFGPARVVFPQFAPEHAAGRSDFNDLAALAGLDAVRLAIDAALDAMRAGEPDPELTPRRKPRGKVAGQGAAADAAASPGNGPPRARRARAGADTPAVASRGPGAPPGAAGGGGGGDDGHDGGPGAADDDDDDGSGPDAGPAAAVADAFAGGRDPFVLDDGGVFYLSRDREGNDRPPQWLCAPLKVTARTRADDANGWGCLLEFTDPDGNAKTWAMPSAMLSGEGAEWAGRLRDMGLRMAPGTAARNRIAQYIDTRNPPERVTCTDRVGWHGPVYVLPSGSIGNAEGRRYVFQSDAGMEDTFRRSGELAEWRQSVARLAQGNSRFVFALACAFAGPTLHPVGMESGGFHLRGTSSVGKTTALKVAASVWGRPTFMQRWRTTDNALEATAVQHCDCTLILDEFGQLDPRVAGECAYLLANQTEKSRSTRSGLARRRRTWRLLFLSSGEVSLADHMAEAGKRTQAGMEVRMVDVPLDAGAGMGGIEDLRGCETPAELADKITGAAARCYGSAGRAWLEWLSARMDAAAALLQVWIDRTRDAMVPEASGEQVRRVASRFALVAAAGELAGEAGITGWPAGHAVWAARQCFEAWLAARGHKGNTEEAAALRCVRGWLEKNGDALTTWHHRGVEDRRPATPLRAGFKRYVDEQGRPIEIDAASDYTDEHTTAEHRVRAQAEVEYLLLPEAFRVDICKGREAEFVARVLKARGHLATEPGRLMAQHRLPGMGKVRCYHVRPSIFRDELGEL